MDEEEYAKIMSKMFIADFYSLDCAINKNDVGGTQFVYKDYQNDFESYAKDTVYRYVENNIYKNRKQSLPNVEKVSVSKIEQDDYETEVASDDKAYYVTLKIAYKEDLQYPTESNLILIHSNDKLEIAAMNYEK
jgi:glutamate synthase domain-containing protein 2